MQFLADNYAIVGLLTFNFAVMGFAFREIRRTDVLLKENGVKW